MFHRRTPQQAATALGLTFTATPVNESGSRLSFSFKTPDLEDPSYFQVVAAIKDWRELVRPWALEMPSGVVGDVVASKMTVFTRIGVWLENLRRRRDLKRLEAARERYFSAEQIASRIKASQ